MAVCLMERVDVLESPAAAQQWRGKAARSKRFAVTGVCHVRSKPCPHRRDRVGCGQRARLLLGQGFLAQEHSITGAVSSRPLPCRYRWIGKGVESSENWPARECSYKKPAAARGVKG